MASTKRSRYSMADTGAMVSVKSFRTRTGGSANGETKTSASSSRGAAPSTPVICVALFKWTTNVRTLLSVGFWRGNTVAVFVATSFNPSVRDWFEIFWCSTRIWNNWKRKMKNVFALWMLLRCVGFFRILISCCRFSYFCNQINWTSNVVKCRQLKQSQTRSKNNALDPTALDPPTALEPTALDPPTARDCPPAPPPRPPRLSSFLGTGWGGVGILAFKSTKQPSDINPPYFLVF